MFPRLGYGKGDRVGVALLSDINERRQKLLFL
jgi:hypothetical protein